jgi:integrase
MEELAVVREAALSVHPRCRPVIDLLSSTGARLQEACAMSLEEVTDRNIVLRDTKRRPAAFRSTAPCRSVP